jgi:hypothetical protein
MERKGRARERRLDPAHVTPVIQISCDQADQNYTWTPVSILHLCIFDLELTNFLSVGY